MAELFQCRGCHRYIACSDARAESLISCKKCGEPLALIRTEVLPKSTASLRAKLFGWFSILLGIYATTSAGSIYGLVAVVCGVLMVIPVANSTRTTLGGWIIVLSGILITAFRGWIGIVATVCGVAILYLQSRKREAPSHSPISPTAATAIGWTVFLAGGCASVFTTSLFAFVAMGCGILILYLRSRIQGESKPHWKTLEGA